MLISHYLVFKNNYVVPNFNYWMLCYVTISRFSLYVSLIGFIKKNDGDDDDDDNDLVSKLRMSGTKYPLPLHALMACTGRTLTLLLSKPLIELKHENFFRTDENVV
jgi:hypothetical protein